MTNESVNTINPFKAWFEKREAKKRELAEKAAMEITNDTAENEQRIITVLEDVDFNHSKLPESVLEQRKNANQPYGDLEYATLAIVAYLREKPLSIMVDLRAIDEKILELAFIFKDAVKTGDVTAALSSKTFLVRAVREIRTSVPYSKKDAAELYIKTYEKYLESCIAYCELAQTKDRLNDACLVESDILDSMEADYKERMETFKKEIMDDEEKCLIVEKISNTTSMAERSLWTKDERDMHNLMVQKRMEDVSIDLHRVKLVQDQNSLAAASGRLDLLSTKVETMPIVVDPNEMNKFQEEVDDLFKEFAIADTKFDESLRAMEDIDGRIKQLDSMPGAIRARELAADNARQIIKEIKEEQEAELAGNKEELDGARRRLGIRSSEEMAMLKEASVASEEAAVEEMMGNTLYNEI